MTNPHTCALCDALIANGFGVEWGRSPWGDGDDWAHYRCADNWEPDDSYAVYAGYPTISERQELARRLK